MRKILTILTIFLAGCSFPFSYEYESEVIELPSLSIVGEDANQYQEMSINIPVDGAIPFDSIDFKDVLIRIEAENQSGANADAELYLISSSGKSETLFKGIIPAGGSYSYNSVSQIMAEGLNKKQFDFTVRAKNNQGTVNWQDYSDIQWAKDIINKYHLNSVDDFLNNEQARDEALQHIDLKIEVKVMLIFKGIFTLSADTISTYLQ